MEANKGVFHLTIKGTDAFVIIKDKNSCCGKAIQENNDEFAWWLLQWALFFFFNTGAYFLTTLCTFLRLFVHPSQKGSSKIRWKWKHNPGSSQQGNSLESPKTHERLLLIVFLCPYSIAATNVGSNISMHWVLNPVHVVLGTSSCWEEIKFLITVSIFSIFSGDQNSPIFISKIH